MSPSVAASGITTDTVTGERHIPSSTRADGSQRREIRVRPGYRPPEDVELYKNRAAAAFRNRGAARGGVPPGAEGLKGDGDGDGDGGQGTAGTAGTASSKNARKREAKRRAKEEGAGGTTAAAAAESASLEGDKAGQDALGKGNGRVDANGAEEAPAAAAATVDPELEKEKKARNLKKKLRQARDLRDKKDQGENLLPEQLEKVIKMQELIRQLDTLGFDADGEKKQQQQQQSGETVNDDDDTTAEATGKTDDNGAGV